MSYSVTSTGKRLNLFDTEGNIYDIVDIAASLSKQCRFNGHCSRFYSVAEHSVRTSYLVKPQNALAALLHDAAEYVLGDVVSPLKHSLEVRYGPGRLTLGELEDIHLAKIFQACGLTFDIVNGLSQDVKDADRMMLAIEATSLVPHADLLAWGYGDITPAYTLTVTMTAKQAERAFLRRYHELKHAQKALAA